MANKRKLNLASTQANQFIGGLLAKRENSSTSSISKKY